MNQKSKIPAISGFKENLLKVLEDDGASFKDLAALLVLQPLIIARLFVVANGAFGKKKPHSVEAIINILGFRGVMNEIMMAIEDAPPEKNVELLEFAVDSYEIACVLAYLAEAKLGRIRAPMFFLHGLLYRVMEENPDIFGNDQEGLDHQFSISSDVDVPRPEHAIGLIQEFRKGVVTQANRHCHDFIWKKASRKVRNTLEAICASTHSGAIYAD